MISLVQSIGSEEMVTINELVDTAAKVANKKVTNPIRCTIRCKGRSNNDLSGKIEMDFEISLERGIRETYNWISSELMKKLFYK